MSIVSLIAENLTCLRGGRLVFRDVSLRVGAGQVLSLEGANGAGKTSLLRMIAGFLAPASGTITLKTSDGDISDGEERGKHVVWLGHKDAIKPQLTPRETLSFFALVYGAADVVSETLLVFGLASVADLPCQYLSAGQRKRLSLARALLSNGRKLWLMDEPLSSLDADGRRHLHTMLSAFSKDGGIAIVATHELLNLDVTRLPLG